MTIEIEYDLCSKIEQSNPDRIRFPLNWTKLGLDDYPVTSFDNPRKFDVIDKELFFLSIIKYGIEYKVINY